MTPGAGQSLEVFSTSHFLEVYVLNKRFVCLIDQSVGYARTISLAVSIFFTKLSQGLDFLQSKESLEVHRFVCLCINTS